MTAWQRLCCSLLLSLVLLAGCTSDRAEKESPSIAKAQDPLAQAAAEATAIIQNARATALVLQAHSQAAALIQQAGQPYPSGTPLPAPAALQPDPTITPQIPAPVAGGTPILASTPTNVVIQPPAIARQGDFELLGISYAADGGFIMVSFTAPPAQVAQLYQGTVSVSDETTGAVYDEIPVMPVIGPMIGRPVEAGQRGYVMLINKAPGLRPGARVTVVLGEIRFEHIPFQP